MSYPHILNCYLPNTLCPELTYGKFSLLYIARNTLCGKLVCHWMHTRIAVPLEAYDMQYTYFGGHVCISANMRDSTSQKRTYVGDGTACGFQRVNINFT